MILTFVCIAIAGFVLLVGGALFGHDHDGGLDHGFDHDHDGDGDHGNESVVSIFSLKVLGTFIMGFGAAGAVARYQGSDPVLASLWGLGFGLGMGALMYLVLRALYGQQANSLVSSTELIEKIGVVTTAIDKDSVGEVDVTLGSLRPSYLARSLNGKPIPRGRTVKVVNINGSQLLVEETR